MITIKGLVKEYPSVTAVSDLNLEVPAGEMFGFLGPNGAGKTTTIKMMVGLLKPTAGRIFIDGVDIQQDPVRVKSVIGYIPDRPFLYDKLTGLEYLEFVSDLYSLDKQQARTRARNYLEFFDLGESGPDLIESYSHGMKQKLIIAGALIHDPRAVIVDEPLVGLDPKGARQVKRLFRELCQNGVAVFMSTHSLGIAEAMCRRVGIIQKGKMIAVGTVEELRRQAKKDHGDLEDIFLKLTGDHDMDALIDSLKKTTI